VHVDRPVGVRVEHIVANRPASPRDFCADPTIGQARARERRPSKREILTKGGGGGYELER
jgi:hypothetical protein